ncbi:PRC-barrel domain-containing protein [Pelagicoccus sp. SDUM812003]|uniref:PRC-barrel domain-containing protein n=1 Tax=Pelagicoccus sp. SDUM812003 TaxID=3041267 RepID=UPI0028109A24|nr:PRC-barrel domain-containing protein [Pelagicoccus sp. SDUM812003]MDQ8202812.1 PRC-barrel domain-containing protein [Pelagicoccus sp. SDUM812003]
MKTKTVASAALLACTLSASSVLAEMAESTKSGDLTAKDFDLSRESQERLENALTAKDLIGASVLDRSGERIGSIEDIRISSLARKLESTGLGTQASSGQASSGTGLEQFVDPDQGDFAYLSVGGLFGIGDDLVKVPLDRLSARTPDGPYVLQGYSRDEVVAFAEGGATETTVEVIQDEATLYEETSSAAKMVWTEDDVSVIREAFNEDERISGVASVITIEKRGDNIVISGSVANETEKEVAEELAAQHTDLTVVNALAVLGSD